MSWLSEIRKRHRGGQLRYSIAHTIAAAILVGFSGTLLYVSYRYFGGRGLSLMEDAIAGLAVIVSSLLAALGFRPVVGREPAEHEAAKAFLEKRDVRADDGKFDGMD